MKFTQSFLLSRRRALLVGSSIAASALVGLTPPALAKDSSSNANNAAPLGHSSKGSDTKLPVKEIENILRSDGRISQGVLTFSQDRKDLRVTGPGGIPFKPAWEGNHEFAFQAIDNGNAIVNGELSLLGKEANPVIDQLLKHGLVFQAFHQHFFDLSPQLFHIHFRGVGKPLELARGIAAVVSVTGTPLPQKSAPERKTPLDKDRLASILGGTAEVEDDGVVVVSVPRKETIVVGGAETGVSHTIAFQPMDGSGKAAVAPDFALIAAEINKVVQTMRDNGFTIHCLYNQETAETPQLYFSHQLAIGDAYDLARKVRKGLEHTNTQFKG